jgi:hypothetical protein
MVTPELCHVSHEGHHALKRSRMALACST